VKLVLDASAALAAVLGQESGPAVLDVLAGAAVVIAPELFTLRKLITTIGLPVHP
jgi:hypothetical protein